MTATAPPATRRDLMENQDRRGDRPQARTYDQLRDAVGADGRRHRLGDARPAGGAQRHQQADAGRAARGVARVPLRRRRALRRPVRRGRGVLHRHRSGRGGVRGEQRGHGGGRLPRLSDALDVRRPRKRRRAQDMRPVEAGDRRGARHGVRRCVLPARRGRVHHRRRRCRVLRPPRHLRDDRGVRADPDAVQDAVPRDHAPVAARCPRAPVGRAGPGGRARERGRARDELRERAGWAARVIADAPLLVVQGMRALWTALEVPRTQAIGMANLFTRIGSDAAAFKAGQDRFSGQRPQWRLRRRPPGRAYLRCPAPPLHRRRTRPRRKVRGRGVFMGEPAFVFFDIGDTLASPRWTPPAGWRDWTCTCS